MPRGLKRLILTGTIALVLAPIQARADGFVHLGLRGDARYLRGFEDTNTGVTSIDLNGNNQLHFWRASFGVVFR